MSGAEFDYDFGSKNNWRRWAWNRLDERIRDKDAGVCLYLPSADDIDRDIATGKGFKDNNLIGVERKSVALALARRRGGLVISGDWWEAVQAVARSDTSISAVFADFCYGIPNDRSLVDMINPFSLPSAVDTVVAFNFMRGRDAPSNGLRVVYEKYVGKHRGKLFAHIAMALTVAGVYRNILRHGESIREQWIDFAMRRVFPRYPSFDCSVLNPAFASYRSASGQYFDSVVMLNPLAALFRAIGVEESRKGRETNLAEQKSNIRLDKKTLLSARAVLAHRTRRREGRAIS